MNLNAADYQIVFDHPFQALQTYLEANFADAEKVIICDEHTLEKCVPLVDKYKVAALENAEVFSVEPGEQSKSIDIAEQIWMGLTQMAADRQTVVVNIGGGVVSDLGGFVAGTYKRGIPFINVPTSLLAMADASVGGKVGINIEGHKNQVGLFQNPEAIYIIPEFLSTLSRQEFLSGYAEMLKHALIADAGMWQKMHMVKKPDKDFIATLLAANISIKNGIVERDPFEKNDRKLLNFGHTLAHAFEGVHMEQGDELLHGQAVAAGMICATYLSVKKCGLSEQNRNEIVDYLTTLFDLREPADVGFNDLKPYLKNDKKNVSGNMMFTLLRAIGRGVINQPTTLDEVSESLFYLQRVV